jgi:phospholipase D1/2
MLQQFETPPREAARDDSLMHQRILRPGDTCWRIARADRFAVIVDAADYFAHAKEAMLKAKHSILLVGWDFDLRIRLTPEDDGEKGRIRLGDFLKELVRRTPGLRIHILQWDMAVLFTMRWQILPMILRDLIGTRRIHLRFDSTHPLLAAHHQKIVVIDDALAFCGGIDMTDHRWDTREHIPNDRRRIDPLGKAYGPWHDSTTAVDGEAARALGELARKRWRFATGQKLPPPNATLDAWPQTLQPQLRNVDVGIARTYPAYRSRKAVHEVERLYLAGIQAARHTIYIENQFLASKRILEALRARLQEDNGPEVLFITPETAESWLEAEIMDSARALCLQRLRQADRHGRFGIYYPVNAAEQSIYVHSKVVVTDNRLLRVGSSNVNNRSMGFDSECDLAIEGTPEEPHTQSTILNLRNNFLAEHLDVSQAAVAQAILAHGSLLRAVEALRKERGRSLRPLPLREVSEAEELLVETRLADPERPAQPERRIEHIAKRAVLRHPIAAAVGFGLLASLALFCVSRMLRS